MKAITKRIASAALAGLLAISSSGLTVNAMAEGVEEKPSYSVTLEQTEGGKILFTDTEETKKSFEAGVDVAFYAVPDDGYQMDQIKAVDTAEKEIEMTTQDNVYHLIMPERDVRITSVFSQVVDPMSVEEPEQVTAQEETKAADENTDPAEESNNEIEEAGEADEETAGETEGSSGTGDEIVDSEPVTESESVKPEDGEPEALEETAEDSDMTETEETGVDDESKKPDEDDKKSADESKETSGEEKTETEEEAKPAEMQWISLSSDEVDAMVGMTSVRRRMLLRASATTIYEGSMNRFYGAATPHLYDSNGNLVYCILPWSASPHGVNVSFNDYNITSASDGNLQLMAKLMYYGYGGGGNILGGYSAADQEAITHFALSYVWMIYMGNTHGYGDWTSSGGSNLDGTGQAIVLNFLSQVQGMPAVTGTLHVAGLYEASGEVYQDLAYGNFTPEEQEGELELEKSSAYPKITNNNDCYSLKGAVYGVYTNKNCSSSSKVGEFTTNADGKSTKKLELEAGTYYVKEISPSPGYLLDTTVYTATVKSDTTTKVPVSETPGNDPVDLILLKRDSETGNPQQGLKLSGAEYTVHYYDVSMDTDPAKSGKTPKKTWVFKTDKDGHVVLDSDHLVSGDSFYVVNGQPVFPLGTITLQETKQPKGYVIDKTVYVANTKRESVSSVVTSNLPNKKSRASEEDIIRGDLKFYKMDAGTRKAMSGIPFSITCVETGESHVIVSDSAGLVSTASADRPHTKNTNQGKTGSDGIWFGTSDPDNSKGALLYGNYVIEELPCEKNYGKDLISFEIEINKNNQVYEYPVAYNYDILLSTTAMDAATETKTVAAEAGAKVTDTVSYENLTVGRTYTLKGTLMDQSTGKAVKIGGNTVTAEKSFTPKASKGTVSMTFNLDASGLAGKTLVVFEELYWNGNMVADHKDINDGAQAVFVPTLKTTATDSQTQDHTGAVTGKAVVKDVVVYTGLTPGKKYHIKGVLMNKETGKAVKQNGNEITAEKDFTPEFSDGSVELSVTVDATLLSGKSTVMFETVTYKDIEVVIHADINDEDQTVHYPEIYTTASDKNTKDTVGTVTKTTEIIDTVSYTNLVAGNTYTVKGVLMDQGTGSELKVNRNSITAETTFKASSASGTVQLTFKLDSSALEGKSVVVFEDLYHNSIKVAVHTDINDEGQTVHYPKIATSAKDSQTADDQGVADENVTITDTVSYTNLVPGKSYTVKGVLMDQETGKELLVNGNAVTAEKTFTPKSANGSVELSFTLNSLAVKGKTTVVFEELYHNGTKVTVHADIRDKGQTVHIPEMHTTAIDKATGDHTGTVTEKCVITDTVSYSNLIPGRTYTVKGVLMDQETGKELLVDGKQVAAETEFTAEAADGEVELIYELDSSVLQGKTVVVFEDLYYKGVKIYTHADITDEKQSVHFPEIHTSAKDNDTKDEVGTAFETAKITDTVSYHNLIPGYEYTVKGVLMNKETGKELKVNGERVTAEAVFTAEEADGTIDITFSLDASVVAGKTTVVFEDLIHNGIKVTAHADLEDKGQTIHYPKIATSAADTQTEDSQGVADNKVTVKDTVTYTNLVAGKEYRISGTLMNQKTGKAVLANGVPVTAEKTFTPDKENGTIELEFVLNSLLVKGQTTVVFEELYHNEIKVTMHSDIEDEGQSVHVPHIRTTAIDGDSKTHTGTVAGKARIVDTVSYTNLIPGKEYAVTGVLMDKETKEPLLVDGKQVTAKSTFTVSEPDGETELVYELDSSALQGKTVVVFEDLYYKGVKIYSHADISDEKQSVHYPEIHTSAKDAVTKDAQAQVSGATTFVDTVSFHNLVPGETYTLIGTLMNKGTKEAVTVDGEKVTAQKTFTADMPDGETQLSFTFDAEQLQGETTVVFEKLYVGEANVTSHEDFNDEGQTVYIPKLRTTAKDQETGSHTGRVGEKVVVEDIVNYSNLIPGREYSVKGTLMNKETGEPVLYKGKEVTAEEKFKAHTPDGSIVLSFTIDSTLLEGQTVVAFENLYHEDILLVSHADITDEDQSVHFPKIGTAASVAGSKTVVADTFVTLTDVVTYENLVQGENYSLQGILMDQQTGKELVVNGNTVKASVDFKADGASGQVEMNFSFDAGSLGGHNVVVFEKLFHNGQEVAVHEDISDEGQTVKFTTPPTITKTPPKTDDPNDVLPFVLAAAAAAAGIGAVLVYGKKRKRM